MGGIMAAASLKLWRVEIRIKDRMKSKVLQENGIDYEEAQEKSTRFRSENIEARTIEEAIRGAYAIHRATHTQRTGYEIEIIAVHFIAEIDRTEKEWHMQLDIASIKTGDASIGGDAKELRPGQIRKMPGIPAEELNNTDRPAGPLVP